MQFPAKIMVASVNVESSKHIFIKNPFANLKNLGFFYSSITLEFVDNIIMPKCLLEFLLEDILQMLEHNC